MPDSPPPFWDELTNEERQQVEGLTDEERDNLTAIFTANVEAKDKTHALKVVSESLDNRRQQPDHQAEANQTKPPRAETARTNTAALEGQQPTELTDEELLEELTDEERQQWDDLTNEEQAAILRKIAPKPDKPTQLKRQLRRLRQKGKAPNPDEAEAQERVRRQHNRPANDQRQPEPEPPKADRQALLKAQLKKATTTADVLDVLDRLEWYERTGAERPSDEEPLTEADLLSSLSGFGQIPTQAETEAAKLLDGLLANAEPNRWSWGEIRLGDEPHLAAADLRTFEFHTVKEIQTLWKQTEHLPHPLAPIVEAWQAQPKDAEPFRPKNRASLANFDNADPEERRLLAIRQPVPVEAGGQMLFDLPELTPAAARRSWLLDLFDRAGGQSMRQGRGAPWDMRLFIGVILHLGIGQRDGEFHRLRFDTSEVIAWLHPKGWPNRARDWKQFPASLFRLNRELGFVAIDGLGYVQILGASIIPKTPDDPHVEFIVRIPKTAAHGARIDWPALCRYGQHSAILYRAYLSAVEFMHHSAHNGQPITQAIGKPLKNADGKPRRAKGGKVRRSTTEFVANPSTRYVRGLTEGELVDMIGLNPTDKNHRRMTHKAFEQLDGDGVIDLEQDGKLWRIFGPASNSS